MLNRTKILYSSLLVFTVLIGCLLWSEARAADKKVYIYFGAPEEILSDRDTTGSGQQAQELLMNTAILTPTLPKTMTSTGEISTQEQEKSEGEAEEAAEEAEAQEEEEAKKALNQLGGMFSFESFSNDSLEREGNAYGLCASIEKTIDPLKIGGLLNYRLFRLSNESTDDYNSNRLTGLIYADYVILTDPLEWSAGGSVLAGYTINNEEIEDYAAYGGGAHMALGKDWGVCKVTVGAAYLYTKYDFDSEDDHSHLIKYGVILGVPIGQKLSGNLFFIDNRNVTDYEYDLSDTDFYTLGTEWIFSIAGSWVVSCGYRTILDYEDFTSHEGYLGSLIKF